MTTTTVTTIITGMITSFGDVMLAVLAPILTFVVIVGGLFFGIRAIKRRLKTSV